MGTQHVLHFDEQRLRGVKAGIGNEARSHEVGGGDARAGRLKPKPCKAFEDR
ncbi:MAG: hypothetical protein AcusKO_42360 [Acuticoccus sp.]